MRAHILIVAVVLEVGAVQGTIPEGQSEDAAGAGTVGARVQIVGDAGCATDMAPANIAGGASRRPTLGAPQRQGNCRLKTQQELTTCETGAEDATLRQARLPPTEIRGLRARKSNAQPSTRPFKSLQWTDGLWFLQLATR